MDNKRRCGLLPRGTFVLLIEAFVHRFHFACFSTVVSYSPLYDVTIQRWARRTWNKWNGRQSWPSLATFTGGFSSWRRLLCTAWSTVVRWSFTVHQAVDERRWLPLSASSVDIGCRRRTQL